MSRKPDEWMPLHIGDYHADTTHLTRDQHGAYLLLLMAYWRRGSALPADDGRLAAIVKATPSEWRKLKPVMAEFFVEQDGGWHQKRADAELIKAKRLTEAKAEAGRKGAANKWHGHNKDDGKLMVEPSISHRQNDAPLPSPSPIPEEVSSLRSESDDPKAGKQPRQRSLPVEPEGFAEFYDAFPLKKARGAALKAWSRAAAKVPAQQLIDAAKRYAITRQGEDPKYTKHPATWLNSECWADADVSRATLFTPSETPSFALQPGESELHHRVRLFRDRNGFWIGPWGYPPTDPLCTIPREILIEFGYARQPENVQ